LRRNVRSLTERSGERLRVGDYRVIFSVEGDTMTILEVKKRDERTY
jgi:mRNA-degrading endonuclease RelE of RelBE toxin-antitoxin system